MDFFTNMVVQFYKQGIYSDNDLPDFIKCGWLTTNQYKELTGKNIEVNLDESGDA